MGSPEGIPFGNYQLIKRLARGGMAEVFLARQTGLEGFDRLVAIKRILPHLVDNKDFVRMFLDEARLAARLSHPNVVHIYEFGKVDEHYFIAMEFVTGRHIGNLIRLAKQAPLPDVIVARIGADACGGLHYAHQLRDENGRPLNIVHRDISPPNLLVSYDGVVKIVDFGIAKAASCVEKTRTGVVKGKYAYMSPEQTTGKPLDGRSDVFSLALVLWGLLAGRIAVSGSDQLAAMKIIRDGKVPAIEAVRPDVPPALAAALRNALAVRPEDRTDAQQLGLALEEYIKSTDQIGSSIELGQFVRDRFPEEPLFDTREKAPGTMQATQATRSSQAARASQRSASVPSGAGVPESHRSGAGSAPHGSPASELDSTPNSEETRRIRGSGEAMATRDSRSGSAVALDAAGVRDLQDFAREPPAAGRDEVLNHAAMAGASREGMEHDTLEEAPTAALATPAPVLSAGDSSVTVMEPAWGVGAAPAAAADHSFYASETSAPPPSSSPDETRSRLGWLAASVVLVVALGALVLVASGHFGNDSPAEAARTPAADRPGGTPLALSSDSDRAPADLPSPGVAAKGDAGDPEGSEPGGAGEVREASTDPAEQRSAARARRAGAAQGKESEEAETDAATDAETAVLEIVTRPVGAAIAFGDGPPLALTPATFTDVQPGDHELVLKLDGYKSLRRSITVRGGEHRTVEIPLTAVAAEKPDDADRNKRNTDKPPPRQREKFGNLRVRTRPYSIVYHRGKKLGITPLAEKLAPGRYHLTFKNPTLPPIERNVVIREGETTKLDLSLED